MQVHLVGGHPPDHAPLNGRKTNHHGFKNQNQQNLDPPCAKIFFQNMQCLFHAFPFSLAAAFVADWKSTEFDTRRDLAIAR